jgi:tRNA-Thr(GGU) m(6)t(6)A37 methyltransferase TsaA
MAPRLQLAAAPVTMLPIGIVHNELWPHEALPRAKSERSLLEIYPPYVEALDDIGVHSHVQVLFVFDKASGGDRPLRQHRCGDPDQPLRGVFALRSPLRPNPIGLTEVELLEVREGELVVSGLDAWDGTPILDIKPYTPPSQSGGSES